MTDIWIKAEWDRLCADTTVHGEGEGVNRELWLPMKKQRFRDVKRFIEQSAEEGGKEVKNPTGAQTKDLREFVSQSMPDFREQWLRPDAWAKPSSSVAEVVVEEGDTASKAANQKKGELAFMIPEAFGQNRTAIDENTKSMREVSSAIKDQFESVSKSTTRGQDSQLDSYSDTCEIRIKLLNVYHAVTIDEMQACCFLFETCWHSGNHPFAG